jgi:ankyrin repeat protein
MFSMAEMLRWILHSCSGDHERSIPLVRLLLDRGADIEPDDDYQGTVLHTAVRQVNCLVVSLLLARGADPNATDDNGKTPLHFAFGCALGDSLFMVKLLLKNGADVNAADVNGRTPLHHACLLGNRFPLAQILLENGANVNAVSKHWGSPLQLASGTCQHDLVALLIAHGAKGDKDVI